MRILSIFKFKIKEHDLALVILSLSLFSMNVEQSSFCYFNGIFGSLEKESVRNGNAGNPAWLSRLQTG